jgi:hypothetical protein
MAASSPKSKVDAMPAKHPVQGPAHQHDALIRQVADSETFRTAPTMRAPLLYLWEHQGEPISEYAIATEGLKLVDEQWKKSGSPDAWEMVIQAEIYRDTVLKTTPVACRAIPATFWK